MSDTAADDTNNDTTRAMMQLMAPDGYYTFLGIKKPQKDEEIDTVALKKVYRRKSLEHHPDRATGHVETFRALNRAHVVLLDKKLRQQYDLLGIDLEEDHHDEKEEEKGDESHSHSATPETLVSAFASAALAGVLQAVVRTGVCISI
jgi:DnaJ-class molecular chaperone